MAIMQFIRKQLTVKAVLIFCVLFATSLLTGCADKHVLAECRGTVVQANVGKWVPAQEDLR